MEALSGLQKYKRTEEIKETVDVREAAVGLPTVLIDNEAQCFAAA